MIHRKLPKMSWRQGFRRSITRSLVILLLAAPNGSFVRPGLDDETDRRAEYLNLQADGQAVCTRYKLDRMMEQGLDGPAERRRHLAEGRRWLELAIEKYAAYSFVNPTSPFDQPAKVWTGKGGPVASPLGLMQHAWRALDGMRQLRATRNLSTAAPPESTVDLQARYRALDEAIEAMGKAVDALEAAQGWVEHGDGMFLTLRVPPEFLPGQNPDYRLCFDWREPESREVGKSLFVSVTRGRPDTNVRDSQQHAPEREKILLPDLVVIEHDQFIPGIRGSWFSYRGTWRGIAVTGLIFHQADRNYIREVKYIARSSLFDAEEGEGIIRSVRGK